MTNQEFKKKYGFGEIFIYEGHPTGLFTIVNANAALVAVYFGGTVTHQDDEIDFKKLRKVGTFRDLRKWVRILAIQLEDETLKKAK